MFVIEWWQILRQIASLERIQERVRAAASQDIQPKIRPKLDRQGLRALIARNGGASGLDVSDYDLSGADLSRLDLTGLIAGKFDSVSLVRTAANMTHTRLTHTNFTRAQLTGVDFSGAGAWSTDFSDANLWSARMARTTCRRCIFRRTDLYTCDFSGAELTECNLEGANLRLARLSDAYLSNIELGVKLLQEDVEEYRAYFERWYIVRKLVDSQIPTHLNERFLEASEIYMNLKNAYLSHGRYREASHAYIKERRVRRSSHSPVHARTHFAPEVEAVGRLSLKRAGFYLRHALIWFGDWLSDITSGYGERPFQAASWSVVIVGLFTFFFRQVGGIENASTWLDYFNYSLASFSTISFETLQPITPLSQTLTSIESLLGIALLALFMFTLGNRINRG